MQSICGSLEKVIKRDKNFSTYQYDDEPFQEIWFPVLKNLLKEANIMLQIQEAVESL